MKKQTRIIIVGFIGLLIVVGAGQMLILRNGGDSVQRLNILNRDISPVQQQEKNLMTIIVDSGNGSRSEEQIEGDTALAVLSNIATQKGWRIETTQHKFGMEVESIGGLKNSNNQKWRYFVNDTEGVLAPDSYILQPNDRVEWKYMSVKL